MKKDRKISVYILLILTITVSAYNKDFAAEPDFPLFFGSNWQKAEKFIGENVVWMEKRSKENNVDYRLVSSVVFPELIRYSAIYDRMEITLLKALYVNYGTEYANFSIGVFQIKPSCAEQILREVSLMHDKKFAAHFRPLDASLSSGDKRAELIKELEDPEKEFLYVIALIKILDRKYPFFGLHGEEDKLIFFATAYNCGFTNTQEYIRQRVRVKSFHIGLTKSADLSSYADVAVFYYRNETLRKPAGILTLNEQNLK